MSNRLALSRPADRIELPRWDAPPSRTWALLSAGRAWLRRQGAGAVALPAWARQDLGLAEPVALGVSVLDFEARRLGV